MQTSDYECKLLAAQRQLRSYALRLTHDAARADDLLQETALRILTNACNYDDRNSFGSWALVIMRNIFLNEERTNCNRSRTFVSGYDDAPDDLLSVAEGESHYTCRELEALIDSLPSDLSFMLRRRTEGYKYEEIAAELGIPVGTVKSRIFLAKKMFKRLLEL